MKMQMTCPEEMPDGNLCGGVLEREIEGEWVYITCQKCKLERVGHINTLLKTERTQSVLERAGIPLMFLGKTFEGDEHNRAARQICQAWVEDFASGGLPAPALWGAPGRGKSHLMAAVCSRLIKEHAVPTAFFSARGLLAQLQDWDAAQELWERVTTVPVLALDDLGAEQQTDWKSDRLDALVDERYSHELPLLIATNQSPRAWEERFGLRSASRLHSMCLPVLLKGPDRRELERVEHGDLEAA